MSLSRRAFLKGVSSAVLGATAIIGIPEVRSKENSAQFQILVDGPLHQFNYGDVQFFDCLQQKQLDETMSILLNLSEDSLLKPFRLRAGLPAPGNDLGGWYDEDPSYDLTSGNEHGFAPGHSFGQWVSALCRAYAISGSKKFKEKAERLIRLYDKTISLRFYEGFRWPTYTFDKLNLALTDAHQYIGLPDAYFILRKTLDAALPSFPPRALDHDEMRSFPHKDESYCWDESYTISENLFLAFKRGAGSRYKTLAERFLKDDTFFNPLSEGKNVLPDHHAYSYTNALSSAMQAYLTLGSQKHLKAAANAFEMIQTTQSFATGGWGPDETFRKPESSALFDSLTNTHNSFETPCGSYAHFKLTRYLLRVTGDSKYGDSMERVMYNTILGALPLQEDGRAFYYSDYNFDGNKFYRNKWTCCSGTLPQMACDYRISTYFHDREGIFVNLFINSSLSWYPHLQGKSKNDRARVTLKQSSNYPLDETIEFIVSTSSPQEFSLRFRIPEWTEGKASLKLNGKEIAANEKIISENLPGFACIRRQWQEGDRIELELPMKLQTVPFDGRHENVVALTRGPLVLFGINASSMVVTREELLAAKRTRSNEWSVATKDGTLILRPFTAIHDEHYSTYFKIG